MENKQSSTRKKRTRSEKQSTIKSHLEELEELFAPNKSTPKNAQKKTKVEVTGSKDDLFGKDSGQERKRTEEGYLIYTEAELGFHATCGGNTVLCPFDCDCCF
eukprot:g5947.t1